MEQNQKNSQLLQVADLGLKRLKNGSLSPEQEAQLNEVVKCAVIMTNYALVILLHLFI